MDEVFSRFISLLGQVTLKDLHLTPKDLDITNASRLFYYPAPVSHVNVFENEIFSLTVFGMRRKSSRIPLHDHPSMHGFMKCIHGAVTVKSYTILQNANCPIPEEICDKVKTKYHDKLNHKISMALYFAVRYSSYINRMFLIIPF